MSTQVFPPEISTTIPPPPTPTEILEPEPPFPSPPPAPEIQEPVGGSPQRSIFDRAVSVQVFIGAIGNSKKISTSLVEVAADKDRINVSKKLLDSPEMKAITKLDNEIRMYLYRMALPSLFKSGVYLVPMTVVPEVEETLRSFKTRRKKLVDDFLAAYEQRKREAATQLRELYFPGDYPTAEKIKETYKLEWLFMNFGTPGKLREISAAFFEEQREKMAERVAEATEEVTLALRKGFQDLVAHLADKLTPKADGTKKTFHGTSVEKVRDFISTFDARNIADDDELKTLVEQARGLLDGVNPADLRKDETVRANVQSGFEAITKNLDALIQDAPSRMISFEDE